MGLFEFCLTRVRNLDLVFFFFLNRNPLKGCNQGRDVVIFVLRKTSLNAVWNRGKKTHYEAFIVVQVRDYDSLD